MRAAALLALLLLAAPEGPLPEGNAYVQRLVGKQRHREDLLDQYTYDVLATREDLDDKGAVTERHTESYEVFFVKGRPVRRMVAKDGLPLPPGKQKDEDRKARELAEAVRAGRTVSERPGLRLSAVLERYDFRAVGRETIDGRIAIVLEFTARPGARPLDHDGLLRQLRGRVWVDEAEEEVVRAELSNVAPLKFGLGLGASVSSLTTRIAFRKVDDAVWLPAEDETVAVGRLLLVKRFRTRIRRSYSGYRRFDVESQEAVAPSPSPSPAPAASPEPNLVPF
jgi:hypothetical protein